MDTERGYTLRDIKRGSEIVFLTLLGVYLFYSAVRITTYSVLWPSWFEKWLRILLSVVAFARLILYVKSGLKILPALLLWVIYFLIYRSDGYSFLLFLGAVTVGCYGIPYRRILKIHLISVGIAIASAVLGAWTGANTNLVYLEKGCIRSAWGICYPTDFASVLFFLMLTFFILVWEKRKDLVLIFALIELYICLAVTHSSTSMTLGLSFLIVLCYLMLEQHIRRIHGGAVIKIVDQLLPFCFLMFACMMLLLVLGYIRGYNYAFLADRFLHNRVRLASEAFQLYGSKAFGTPFSQNGAGFSTFKNPNYNFVDSSYALILIRYGWVIFVVYCIIWGWMTRKAVKNSDRALAFVLALVALHSFSEHHFTELHYNIFLTLPFADLTLRKPSSYRETDKDLQLKTGKVWTQVIEEAISAAVPVFCIGCFFPMLLSVLRTIWDMVGDIGGAHSGTLRFSLTTGVLLVLIALWWSFYMLLKSVFLGRKVYGFVILMGLLSLLGCVVKWKSQVMLRDAQIEHREMIEADRHALEVILSEASGKVYADEFPELYQREFGKMAISIYHGDDLARFDNVTVMMAADHDSKCMIASGFHYAEISEYHCVYTNDEAIVNALEEAGYSLSDYYAKEKFVDLQEAAISNALAVTDEGALIVNKEDSLMYGPYLNLYKGNYEVVFSLHYSESIPKETEACILLVSAYYGTVKVGECIVTGADFDSHGNASVMIPFRVGDYSGVEFHVFSNLQKDMEINSITYYRTSAAKKT